MNELEFKDRVMSAGRELMGAAVREVSRETLAKVTAEVAACEANAADVQASAEAERMCCAAASASAEASVHSAERVAGMRALFVQHFGEPCGACIVASAPGRLELAGNHTDHQGGCVISASIDSRAYALAAPNGREEIRLYMDGFGHAAIDLADAAWAEPVEAERGQSVSIARGMAAAFVRKGGQLGGFDVVTTSDIPVGFGVSSSAAFEMLMGGCVEALFGCSPQEVDRIDLALTGMHVERGYFGKPAGAQDQLTSSVGGVVAMNFASEIPTAEPVAFDLGSCAYLPCLIDSRCDHSLYNDEFATVPVDMLDVARWFGCEGLEGVDRAEFFARLPELRECLGDGRALRALHYFDETVRVKAQRACLERGDFEAFLAHARLSGASSAQYLQNVSPKADGTGSYQPAMVILALCAHLLADAGAWRIHGGGFGGSVLAFVPRERVDSFVAEVNACLGYDACTLVGISDRGVHWERLS